MWVMADKTTKANKTNPFRIAYSSAKRELERIKEEEKNLAIRRAQLQETVRALSPLVFNERLDVNSLSLSNAIRLIFSGTEHLLTPLEVRGKLRDLGFNLEQYENPLANIHTALNRMAESEELTRQDDADQKKFNAGPALKPVPERELPPGEIIEGEESK
jgi:hypothetical protein